ncbi:WbqC family protein [Aurantibacillus circumpalustris]|uniref:WbqC family protein n=1 Tax=Aurantibacillus circumpalustris TaxID=3036359 RepID=UPI00295B004B|nr:WbqC family protein [Aurantibacillus circumpalustris]
MKSILSCAYWPNLHYFYYLLNSEAILIEQFENYQRQSFRNRTSILSANGLLSLSIPALKQGTKELTKDVEISYAEQWQTKHWRAITSAYKNSPYFEHFESEIEPLYSKKFQSLLEYNLLQIETIFKILKLKKNISLTTLYNKEIIDCEDLREKIHPKLDFKTDDNVRSALNKNYYQTFESKFSFVPNLSILDLIFNEGLGALDYLMERRQLQ